MEIKPAMVAITAAVVVIVIAAVLMPVLDDARDTAGDEIVKTNVGTGHTFKEMEPGDVLKCESIYSDSSRTDTWTLNGETVLNEGITGLSWDWGLITDVYYMQINSQSNAAVGGGRTITADSGVGSNYSGADATHPTRIYSWTMNDDKTITYKYDDTVNTPSTVTYNSTWAYVLATLDEGAYMSAQVTTNSYYAKYDAKDIILAGAYTTGELDTGYYYGKDGILTILNTDYTGTINFTQTKSSGTTDIYDTLLTVSVTDGNDTESFSPYRALVPYQVSGHESSGAAYDLYGAIPVIVIAALILGVVGVILTRRSD